MYNVAEYKSKMKLTIVDVGHADLEPLGGEGGLLLGRGLVGAHSDGAARERDEALLGGAHLCDRLRVHLDLGVGDRGEGRLVRGCGETRIILKRMA